MTLKNAKILVVDDDTDVLTAVRLLLKTEVKEVVTEKNPENMLQLLSRTHFDLVLLDMNFNSSINTGNEGLFWLKKIKSTKPTTAVVMITAYGDIDLAVRSLKEEAADFMIKPWNNQKLLEVISEALSGKKMSAENKNTGQVKNQGGQQLLGDSDAMKDVFLKIEKIAPTDANVLILGENGTGKDLIAQAIHHKSLRKDKPFVKVDAGALTESLFESELFGHKKGAFTDARADRVGRFEAANGGTIFLDEIGNISLQQQAKLLSVLQNRQVMKLGSNEQVPIDIRLICATNMPLQELADESKFRKDLIYRINTVELMVPPLRNRKQDIMLLSNYYAAVYGKKYLKSKLSFGKSAEDKLMAHGFPGNVRELQYIIERAVIMADDSRLAADDLIFSPIEKKEEIAASGMMKLSNVEKITIINAIEKHQGNITQAAKELGLTRTALYRRLSKYDL
ncbi:two-component system response regulator HydG [Pedobacter sp. UYP30]|uniref:sigma-54-dependent transcriptional regulator n=1 Tax=Pedobacter sp. UYP30 TaxID=1756400 RepID=UPI003399DC06